MITSPMGPGFFIFFQEETGSYGASPDLLNITVTVPEHSGVFRQLFKDVFGEGVKEDTRARESVKKLKRVNPEDVSTAFPNVRQQIRKKPKKAKELSKKLGIVEDLGEDDLEMVFLFLLLSEI